MEHCVFFFSHDKTETENPHKRLRGSLFPPLPVLPRVSSRVDVFMNRVHGSASRLRALVLILPQVRRGRAGAFLLDGRIRAHQASRCTYAHQCQDPLCMRVRAPSLTCVSMGALGGV